MPPDEMIEPMAVQPARGASHLYLATVLALGGTLLAEFLTGYALLRDHPGHAAGLLPEFYGALVIGLLVLALQAVLVFNGLIKPLRQAIIRVEHLAHALDQHSHRDSLTGALNRTAFDQMIVRELEALRRYGVGFCGIMLDVDGFRQLNERLGYETGDQLLFALVQLLRRHVRKADFVFRWRSGRFLILASGITAVQGQRFAEKLRDLVADHRFHPDASLTACLGVAQAQPEDSPEIFIAHVKDALAKAKAQGPGKVSHGAE